jgi:ATP/maltotriose-dependent transcriptional regulator MalT
MGELDHPAIGRVGHHDRGTTRREPGFGPFDSVAQLPAMKAAVRAVLAPRARERGRRPRRRAAGGLTRREHEVLLALVRRGSNASVGDSLFVGTVKTHLAALHRKLGVNSREEALAAGRRLGLV